MYILKLPGNVIAVDIVGIKDITSFVVVKFFSFVKIWDVSWPRGDFRKKNRWFEDNRQIGEGGQAQTRNTKWF